MPDTFFSELNELLQKRDDANVRELQEKNRDLSPMNDDFRNRLYSEEYRSQQLISRLESLGKLDRLRDANPEHWADIIQNAFMTIEDLRAEVRKRDEAIQEARQAITDVLTLVTAVKKDYDHYREENDRLREERDTARKLAESVTAHNSEPRALPVKSAPGEVSSDRMMVKSTKQQCLTQGPELELSELKARCEYLLASKELAEKNQRDTMKKWINFKSWWHAKSKHPDRQSHKGHRSSPFKTKTFSPLLRSPQKRRSPRMGVHRSDSKNIRPQGDSPSPLRKKLDQHTSEKSADESGLTLFEIINPMDHQAVCFTSTPSRKRKRSASSSPVEDGDFGLCVTPIPNDRKKNALSPINGNERRVSVSPALMQSKGKRTPISPVKDRGTVKISPKKLRKARASKSPIKGVKRISMSPVKENIMSSTKTFIEPEDNLPWVSPIVLDMKPSSISRLGDHSPALRRHVSPMKRPLTESGQEVAPILSSPSLIRLGESGPSNKAKRTDYAQSDSSPKHGHKTINALFEIDTSKNGGLAFQYHDVTRNKHQRKGYDAGDCECCQDYYHAVGPLPARLQPPLWKSPSPKKLKYSCRHQEAEDITLINDEDDPHFIDLDKHKREISRHRHKWTPPRTPPGYWEIGFPSTQEVEDINSKAEMLHNNKLKKVTREARNNGRYKRRQ